jgi:transposase InsO family protein
MAFAAAKTALATATLLHHPDQSVPMSVTVDASGAGLGAELAQLQAGIWRPICFFSRKLSSEETKYSAFDRELLAIYETIKYFRHHVKSKPLTIYTDHMPLMLVFSSVSDRSPCQTNHLSYVAKFTTDVRHISGKDNVVADTLSCAVCSAASVDAVALPTINYAQLAADQASSAEIAAYRTAVTGLTFANVTLRDTSVLCDTSTGLPWTVVPSTWTRRVFDAVHGLSHAGARPTQGAVSSRFVWHGLKKDVRRWCQECHACQSSKVHRHMRAPLVSRPPLERRFGSLHVDLVGPLPGSEGYTYFFTIIDRFTRWPEAIPLSDAAAVTCARAMIRGWISRFVIPDDITSDRGPQFTSDLWQELSNVLGIASSTTTAYHPQANGMVERLHRQLKAALKARLDGPKWMDELPLVLLGVRSSWREGADNSAAELVYGSALRVPGKFVPGSSRSAVPSRQFPPIPAGWHARHATAARPVSLGSPRPHAAGINWSLPRLRTCRQAPDPTAKAVRWSLPCPGGR